jgi:hypothetical protein
MATDSLEICNSALTIVGTRKISALSDPSPEGRECNANYDICRKAVLRDHPWNFAIKRVILSTPDATPPAFGFSNRFPLPNDFLRVHQLFDSSGNGFAGGDYVIESGFLLTDESILWLKYVWNITTTTLFDPLFDNALAANIAAKIAYKLVGSEQRAIDCQKAYMDAITKAKYTDSIEDPSPKIDEDEWLRARMGRGDFVRDPGT